MIKPLYEFSDNRFTKFDLNGHSSQTKVHKDIHFVAARVAVEKQRSAFTLVNKPFAQFANNE